MSKKQSNSHNSVEIKKQAVKEVLDNNRSVAEVANEFRVHRDTVNRWVNAYKKLGDPGLENLRSHSSLKSKNSGQDVQKLERKIKELELENEILKKFQAFLKESK
jgi:transposase